jgi:hypothetical protein
MAVRRQIPSVRHGRGTRNIAKYATIAICRSAPAALGGDPRSSARAGDVDTVVGIAVGIACKWVAPFLFYKSPGKQAV